MITLVIPAEKIALPPISAIVPEYCFSSDVVKQIFFFYYILSVLYLFRLRSTLRPGIALIYYEQFYRNFRVEFRISFGKFSG